MFTTQYNRLKQVSAAASASVINAIGVVQDSYAQDGLGKTVLKGCKGIVYDIPIAIVTNMGRGTMWAQAPLAVVAAYSNYDTTVIGNPTALTGITGAGMTVFALNNAVYAYDEAIKFIDKAIEENAGNVAIVEKLNALKRKEGLKSAALIGVVFAGGTIYGLASFGVGDINASLYLASCVVTPGITALHKIWHETSSRMGFKAEDMEAAIQHAFSDSPAARVIPLTRESLQAQIQTLTAERDDLKGTNSTLRQERDNLAVDKSNLEGRLEILTGDIRTLREQLATSNQAKNEIEASLRRSKEENLALKASLEENKREKRAVKQLLDTVTGRLQDIEIILGQQEIAKKKLRSLIDPAPKSGRKRSSSLPITFVYNRSKELHGSDGDDPSRKTRPRGYTK